jgi:hypothetical protein
MLSFLANPQGGLIGHLNRQVSQMIGSAIQLTTTNLAVNVHGSDFYQQPRNFPKQMRDRSTVLNNITSAGAHPVRACTEQSLPSSPLDRQHLNKWREAADYAATLQAVIAGTVGLETGFKSPLLGGSKLGWSGASSVPFVQSLWYNCWPVTPNAGSCFACVRVRRCSCMHRPVLACCLQLGQGCARTRT